MQQKKLFVPFCPVFRNFCPILFWIQGYVRYFEEKNNFLLKNRYWYLFLNFKKMMAP